MNRRELPLVNILIPNYNHSRYLDQCMKSAIQQSYPNKEIILLDNCSNDDSIKVALKYREEGVLIGKNQKNILNINYKILANEFARGEYFILLCADDYIEPDFIEQAVAIMERYPHVGYVHGERDFVTPDDKQVTLDPFYNCSFVAPGRSTMPVYMVTTVAHPAQGLIRKAAFDQIGGYDMEIEHMNADRSMWFYLSYQYDAAYIRKKMAHIRIGEQTETMQTQRNFQHGILSHLIIKDFVNFAKHQDLPQVYHREKEALERLAHDFVGYAAGMIYQDDFKIGKAYLDYARIVFREIIEDPAYQAYSEMIERKTSNKEMIFRQNQIQYQHVRNYNPPEGFEKIKPEEIVTWMKEEYKL